MIYRLAVRHYPYVPWISGYGPGCAVPWPGISSLAAGYTRDPCYPGNLVITDPDSRGQPNGGRWEIVTKWDSGWMLIHSLITQEEHWVPPGTLEPISDVMLPKGPSAVSLLSQVPQESRMKSLVKVRNDGGKACSASKLKKGDYFLGRTGELRQALADRGVPYIVCGTGEQGNQAQENAEGRPEQVQRVDVLIRCVPRQADDE